MKQQRSYKQNFQMFNKRFLLALALCATSCQDHFVQADKDDKTCEKLLRNFKRGYLLPPERDSYCMSGCDFLNVRCISEVDDHLWKVNLVDLHNIINSAANTLMNGEVPEISTVPDYATISVWWALFYRVWTIFLSVVPVLLNQWKIGNFWLGAMLQFIMLMMFLSGLTTRAIGFHNVLITWLSMINSNNSAYLAENVWTVGIMLIPLFAIFITDYIWHVVIMIVSILGFAAYTYHCFYVKRRTNDSSMVILVAQLFVLIEQLYFIRSEFAETSIGSQALEMMISCIVPSGKSRLFIVNTSAKTMVLLGKLMPGVPINAEVFMCVLTAQIVCFIIFRASLGAYYLHILRYRTDFSSIMYGLWVYVADFFGPFICLYRLVFAFESFSQKRLMYAVVGILMMLYEFQFAYGFFSIRLIFSIVDIVFLKTKYGRMTHYLEFNVDFMQIAFPQKDALPWMSLDTFAKISKFTGPLYSVSGEKTVKGIGTILVSGGRGMLYTVNHVVKGTNLVRFLNYNLASPDFRKVALHGDDPMVAMKIECDEAPNVELLTSDEAFFVKHLVFINTSDDGDPFICIVPKFSISKGKLHAHVNLKKGDSGGPCFAVLESGEIRMCGVVSSGNPRHGGGNIISFCYHNNEIGADSSDEEDTNNVLGDVKQFNAQRRVRFRGEDENIMYEKYVRGLHDFIMDEIDTFLSMRAWKNKLNHENIGYDEDYLTDHVMFQHRDDDNESGDDGDNPKVRKRHNQKQRNKEKAFRKRAVNVAKIFWEKLQHCYAPDDVNIIFDVAMTGNLPQMDRRTFIVSTNGNSWITTDEIEKHW
jgi:hypothetical protein